MSHLMGLSKKSKVLSNVFLESNEVEEVEGEACRIKGFVWSVQKVVHAYRPHPAGIYLFVLLFRHEGELFRDLGNFLLFHFLRPIDKFHTRVRFCGGAVHVEAREGNSFLGNHAIFFFMLFLQDYGIWERGDKTNQGIPELNASSVGMAKVRTSS